MTDKTILRALKGEVLPTPPVFQISTTLREQTSRAAAWKTRMRA